METYFALKNLYLLTAVIAAGLLILRHRHLVISDKCRARVVPHANNSVLLASGAPPAAATHCYPLRSRGTWLTEKRFGVIIYIALGFIAPGNCSQSQQICWFALLPKQVVFYIIIKFATAKIPLLG